MSDIIILTDSLTSGGAQKQIVMLANGLAKSGYKVKIIQYYHYNFFKNQIDDSIEILYCTHQNKLIRTLKIIICLYRENPRNLIAFLFGASNISGVYKFLFFWRKTNLIVGERNLDSRKLRFVDFFPKRFGHHVANYIVSNSYAQYENLKHYFKNKILVIPNGTKCSEIKTKQDFSVSKTLNLLVPARFIDQKNPIGLLEALMEIEDIKVSWYGEVFEGYPIYKKALVMLKEEKLKGKFSLNPPVLNIYEKMLEYDAMILPSFYEGCPNAIIDAMLCGLPVLASKVSDNEIYLNHQRELLFDPHSIKDLIEKIELFRLKEEYERSEIGNYNRINGYKFFDFRKMVDSYINLLEN